MARLDMMLVERGIVQSRARAKRLIQEGQVLVNGNVCKKPAFAVGEADILLLRADDFPYVGRGGLKLAHAIRIAKLDVVGKIGLDIGASTGGFTDCMLRHGAAKVFAVDVGHDQLAASLRQDSRVINLEGTDIRTLSQSAIGTPVDIVTSDVSFISQELVLPAAVPFCKENGMFVILIKPQFEAGRSAIGKHGIVRDKKAHEAVLQRMLALFQRLSLELVALCPSPIMGGSGNVEYLAILKKSGQIGMTPAVSKIITEAFHQTGKEQRT